MTPLESPVRDTTLESVTLELSVTILEASFDNRNMFIAQATEQEQKQQRKHPNNYPRKVRTYFTIKMNYF